MAAVSIHAAHDLLSSTERKKFLHNYDRIMDFSVQDKEQANANGSINHFLDELNSLSLEYSSDVILKEEGSKLLSKLCGIVSYHEEFLITKFCQTIFNIITKTQTCPDEKCLLKVTEFLIQCLNHCPKWTYPDLLRALAAVLYERGGKVRRLHESLLGEHDGALVLLSESADEDLLKGVLHCMENISLKTASFPYLDEKYVLTCLEIFHKVLYDIPSLTMDMMAKCRILCHTLRGLHNVVLATRFVPTDNLGPLLSGVWAYVFHGLPNYPLTIPVSLYPIPMNQYNLSQANTRTAKSESATGQLKKKKKKVLMRKAGTKYDDDDTEVGMGKGDEMSSMDDPLLCNLVNNQINGLGRRFQMSSSESELSDGDGSYLTGKQRSAYTKVRQAALGCLYAIIKFTDRKVIFGYWMSFVPDLPVAANTQQVRSLLTIIIRDPSPKCRLGALGALSALLEGTRSYLAAAEYSDQVRTAFTPFSLVLGSTLKELHRSLLLAVVSENYPLTLTQLVKCLSTLVANSPYHRLKPGMLTRVVKQLRHLVTHRDPNIRVACLTCFGTIVSLQPALAEVCHIIQSSKLPSSSNYSLSESFGDLSLVDGFQRTGRVPERDNRLGLNEADNFAQFHENLSKSSNQPSEPLTPVRTPSGLQTPVMFLEQTGQVQLRETSWLIKLCVRNILPQPSSNDSGESIIEPVPIRLESLQILAHLTKNYFPMIRRNVGLLQSLIQTCMEDRETVLKLHAIKLLDELTQVIGQDLQNASNLSEPNPDVLTSSQALEFWEYLLTGPLHSALQSEDNSPVCASACDCLSNIGPDIFPLLPRPLRILCLTSVLSLTMGGDKLVMASAVRSIGVYVLLSCLREDLTFMSDAAHTILTLMTDQSTTVRMKAAWALANFCDALALNRENKDEEFLEDFSDSLLLKLFETATNASQDNDKIRSNGVRALGNLLRYLSDKSLENSEIQVAIQTAVKSLVQNTTSGIMKVRWNACYALSNLLKNTFLSHGETEWSVQVFSCLCSVVEGCTNFKVRINAALALGSPSLRKHYGPVTLFLKVWNSLVLGLVSSTEKVTDFSEFKHRDTLIGQIFSTILHMASLLEAYDLDHLNSYLPEQSKTILNHLESYRQNAPLQRAQIEVQLKLVIAHLNQLNDESLSKTAKEAIDTLQVIFLTDNLDDSNEEKFSKSAFKQVYD